MLKIHTRKRWRPLGRASFRRERTGENSMNHGSLRLCLVYVGLLLKRKLKHVRTPTESTARPVIGWLRVKTADHRAMQIWTNSELAVRQFENTKIR